MEARPERGAIRPSVGETVGQLLAGLCVPLLTLGFGARLTSSSRYRHADVGVDKGFATRRDDGSLGGIDIVAGGKGAATGG